MKVSLRILLSGAVDYAGLFPPASLDMPAAVREFAGYLHDPAHALLGRFVVPVLRLPEFERCAAPLLPRHERAGEPWALAALVGADATADARLIDDFNARHGAAPGGRTAVIESVELRATTTAEIDGTARTFAPGLERYYEIPLAGDPAPLVAAIRRAGAGAKARTGGVTRDAFPDARQIARFVVLCRDAEVPCKFTAGLHHPLRGTYRLTYQRDSTSAPMFGFLNVLITGALACGGAGEDELVRVLEESDPHAFEFRDDAIVYRGATIPIAQLRRTRSTLARSFGSCSFREPVNELAALAA